MVESKSVEGFEQAVDGGQAFLVVSLLEFLPQKPDFFIGLNAFAQAFESYARRLAGIELVAVAGSPRAKSAVLEGGRYPSRFSRAAYHPNHSLSAGGEKVKPLGRGSEQQV